MHKMLLFTVNMLPQDIEQDILKLNMEINQKPISSSLIIQNSIKDSFKTKPKEEFFPSCSFMREKPCRKSNKLPLSNYLQNPDKYKPHASNHNVRNYQNRTKIKISDGSRIGNPPMPVWPRLDIEHTNMIVRQISPEELDLLNTFPPYHVRSEDSSPFLADPSLHYYCDREYEFPPELLKKKRTVSSEMLLSSFELLQSEFDVGDDGIVETCEPFAEIKGFPSNFVDNNLDSGKKMKNVKNVKNYEKGKNYDNMRNKKKRNNDNFKKNNNKKKNYREDLCQTLRKKSKRKMPNIPVQFIESNEDYIKNGSSSSEIDSKRHSKRKYKTKIRRTERFRINQ